MTILKRYFKSYLRHAVVMVTYCMGTTVEVSCSFQHVFTPHYQVAKGAVVIPMDRQLGDGGLRVGRAQGGGG